MPVTRMRMRPWLEAKIESEAISGLKWVDQEKQMFSIPWKHAARHGWEVDRDACLFKQWAIHTGKFKQGETEPDPKTWKANFRCAMNSLPDIEEVKDRSVNRGSSAVRVYRMLQVTAKPTDKRCKRDPKRRSRSSKVKEEVSDSGDSCSGERRSSSQLFEGRGSQESRVDSSDGLCEPTYTETEVPDFVTSVDVVCADPDSTSQHYAFQVSPEHSPAYGDMDMDTEAIIEITQQLEQDHTQWLQGKGFPTNEVCSAESYPSPFPTNEVCTAESYPSPASQWSESSGEELELRLYTELSSGLPSTDELLCYTDYWSHSNTNFLQQISCPY